jgi:PAS domain S-box-containing protein
MPLTNLPNLLIVDDNKENLAFLCSLVRKIQVNLIQALSGPEALEKIQGVELALAIIDVHMPGMDGTELAREINKERAGAKVPIIFLTAGYFDDMAVLSGYDSGAVDYIFKPVTPHILLSKINVFLDLFIQKQIVIQKIAQRIQAEEELKLLAAELEDRVNSRTSELVKSNAAINQIQKNYETFFNSIDDYIFVLDSNSNIIQANTTVLSRLGYTAEELIGKSFFSVHQSECNNETGTNNCQILSRKKTLCSAPLLTKSGIQVLVETKTSSGFWNSEPVIFSVSKDISKIRLSEEKFSKVFHINPSACGLSNLDDFKYVDVNEAFHSLFGFEKSEVIGNTAIGLGIMTPETRNAILLKADHQGIISNVETDLKSKSGEIKHVILSSENINVQDKNYRFTVVHDITKRKRAEKALRKSEARLNKAQQIAHIGSWELIESTRELHWSDETFRIFGYTPREVETTMELFMQHIHPENKAALLESIEAARISQKPYSVDHQIILRDGKVRFVHEQAEIIYNHSGQPEKWFGTVQDITERKNTENELVKSVDQLRQLSEHVEKVREEERISISRELHDDLGQALTAVKIDLGLISQKVTGSDVGLKINKVNALVGETIKTVQRITSQLRPPIIDDLGLVAAIDWYTNEFVQRTGIEVLHTMDSKISMSAQASLIIFRIMQESLTNIARHSKATHVEIVLSNGGDFIDFSISDNGIGISETKINSKESFGIISMKERTASLGGTFDINYKRGCGTEIKLMLPLNKEEVVTDLSGRYTM